MKYKQSKVLLAIFTVTSLLFAGESYLDIPLSEEEINDKDYYTIQHEDFFGTSEESDEDFFGTSSEDDFFGSSSDEEDFFGSEDDLFSDIDDGIEELDTTSKSDLSQGVLFEEGSIKIGGNFRTGINTNTVLYSPNQKNFGKNLKDTTFTPDLSAYLTLDARPNQNLRMYTKFGLGYPFKSSVSINLNAHDMKVLQELGMDIDGAGNNPIAIYNLIAKYGEKLSTVGPNDIMSLAQKLSIKDWLQLKELFTDFNVKDTAFFRFGIHTVTWGAGYFFSPVSDIINTSSIDPENPTEQVDGSLNLRTQIIFPNTTNCLWLYVVPDNNFQNISSAQTYLRDTALAAKYEFVIGDWELGIGGFYKYQNPLKLTLTANGSIKKLSLFGELVYQYGSDSQWLENKDSWKNKKSIFHATLGGFYTWKTPGIMVGMQYYYDGNDKDFMNRIMTNGHNIALMANFSKFGSIKKLSANLFAMVNFDKKGLSEAEKKGFEQYGVMIPELPVLVSNISFNYAPTDNIRFNMGPGLTFTSWKKKPTVTFKIGATLGGGKF